MDEAHVALLEADAERIAEALREVLFLAADAVGDDPDDVEVCAMVLVEAFVTLVEEAAR